VRPPCLVYLGCNLQQRKSKKKDNALRLSEARRLSLSPRDATPLRGTPTAALPPEASLLPAPSLPRLQSPGPLLLTRRPSLTASPPQ
jgi:hypothetical protein